jgi:hypothetical protein
VVVKLNAEETIAASVPDMFYVKMKEKVAVKSEYFENHLVDGQRGCCDGRS